jgi:hypothetical protein
MATHSAQWKANWNSFERKGHPGYLHTEPNTKAQPQISIIAARGTQRAGNRWRGAPRRCRIFDDSWPKEADVSDNLLDENWARRGIDNRALKFDLGKKRKAAAETAEE